MHAAERRREAAAGGVGRFMAVSGGDWRGQGGAQAAPRRRRAAANQRLPAI
jgi:hypothetical protein